MAPDSFHWCPVTGQDAKGMNCTEEAPSEHQQTLFDCEGGQVLAQAAQAGSGISLFGEIQSHLLREM